MSAQHMPEAGDWFVFPQHPDRFVLGDRAPSGTCRVVADFARRPCITGSGDETPSEAECLARVTLAAAAPDLLAALRALHANMHAQDLEIDAERPTEDEYRECMRNAKAAIVKATGSAS